LLVAFFLLPPRPPLTIVACKCFVEQERAFFQLAEVAKSAAAARDAGAPPAPPTPRNATAPQVINEAYYELSQVSWHTI
jgi:hypothetical protein